MKSEAGGNVIHITRGQRACYQKHTFETKQDAKRAAKRSRLGPKILQVYDAPCRYCGKWHLMQKRSAKRYKAKRAGVHSG